MNRDTISKCSGWALHMLSITLLTWEMGSQGQLTHAASRNSEILSLSMLIAYSLAFIALAFWGLRRRRIGNNRQFAVLSLILVIIGAAFADIASFGIAYLKIVGYILIGASNAVLFALWQRVLSLETTYRAGTIIAAASCSSTVLFLVLCISPLRSYPIPLACIANVASALISITCSSDSFDNAAVRWVEHGFRFLFTRLWKSILCVAALGFVWELVTSFILGDPQMADYAKLLPPIANLAGTALLIPLWVRFHNKINLIGVYQILFPIVATGFVLVPFLGFEYRLLFASSACLIFGVVSMLMQITCIQEYKRSTIDPAIIAGIFAGCVYAFTALGYYTGHFLLDISQIGFSQLLVIALVFVYALSLILAAIHIKKTHSSVPDETDDIDKRCKQIAQSYNLTDREADVLTLIVRGRDLPYISDKLYISKNTVRSHSKSIYRKLEIHSKQELLSIFEDAAENMENRMADTNEK